MFGLFYGILQAFGIAGKEYKDFSYMYKSKNKARENGDRTYLDRQCNIRSMENNHLLTYTTDHNGDLILRDLKTWETLDNITDRARNEEIVRHKNEAIVNGDPIYESVYSCDLHKLELETGVVGKRYRYINGNTDYVIRNFGLCGQWLMDAKTGYIVALTEKFKNSHNYGRSSCGITEMLNGVNYLCGMHFNGGERYNNIRQMEYVTFDSYEEFQNYFNRRQDMYKSVNGGRFDAYNHHNVKIY